MITYREHHAVCQSELKTLLRKSPAHLFAEKFGGAKREETPDLWRGSYVHCKLLTPELADDFPLYKTSGEKYKAEMDRSLAETPDRAILDTWINRLGAIIEEPIFGIDPDTGLEIKGQPDVYLPDSNVIVDLKTTQDASPAEFERSVWKYGYHIQAAFYIDLVKRKYGTEKEPEFLILALEKSAPYCVASYYLEDDYIAYGRTEYKIALQRYAECKRKIKYPGYGKEPRELQLPRWIKGREL